MNKQTRSLELLLVVMCLAANASGQDVDAEFTEAGFTFRKVMSAPAEFDDNFTYAVIAVSAEQKALVARNYIKVGSTEQIAWLRENPERRGNRLFLLDSEVTQPVRLSDSTTFGFVPNSSLLYLMNCFDVVRFWDTETRQQLDVELTHEVASECAGPGPAVSPDGTTMATQTKNALQFWDLQTFEPRTAKMEKEWSWDMQFSSDGEWFLHRGSRQLVVRDPKTAALIAGPFRHDVVAEGFTYHPGTQQLVTFENSSNESDNWNSTAVIRSADDWSGTQELELPGLTREAQWVGSSHLLIVADEKRPGRRTPYTYGRNLVSLVALRSQQSSVTTISQHGWIQNTTVAPDAQHFTVTTRDGVSCWRPGKAEPVWTRPSSSRVMFGQDGWVLLQQGTSAIVCSVANGEELHRWNDVVTSRVDGSTIWLCSSEGIDVWRAEKE